MEEIISVLQTENTTSRTLLEMNSDLKKVQDAKYNKKKSGSNGCKPKNSIPQSSGHLPRHRKAILVLDKYASIARNPILKVMQPPPPLEKLFLLIEHLEYNPGSFIITVPSNVLSQICRIHQLID